MTLSINKIQFKNKITLIIINPNGYEQQLEKKH